MKKTKEQFVYKRIQVICSCGHTFETKSTYKGEVLKVEVCSKCHPFYSKSQEKTHKTARAEDFKKKFGDI